MAVLEHQKRFDRNRDELHAIAKEFAAKIKDNPGVAGIVAKPYGAYLHLITLLELDIPRELEYEVYDAYGEIFDKYDGEIIFEFDPITCLSPETIDEVAYDDASNIIYRKGEDGAKRDNPHNAGGAK
ncbi:hypothetical protein FJZ31_31755 [Candidatus Poribacteria bacterium]|nr:hypothetical protein [Candidatus Poribacteria bacterium]